MNSHSRRSFLAVTLALGLSLLIPTATTVSGGLPPAAQPGLCSSGPASIPASGGTAADLAWLSAAILRAPDTHLTGLIGALGQMIVEAELSHAVISGRFEPVINASVAGSEFTLEVCRDAIVGEVSVAQRPSVRFVIGDFDGDGVTDVAVRRSGSPDWSVDLGALRRTVLGVWTPAQLHRISVARPGFGDTAGAGHCQVTWLVQGPRAGTVDRFNG